MNKSFKDFLLIFFFFISRVGTERKQIPVCEKKNLIAHNFFVTKATDLKTIFLKSPSKIHVEKCVTL